MDFILENKWLFLIAGEIVFWVSILTFLIMRYWFKFKKASVLFFAIFILNDLWIATIGFMDYMETGKFSIYQIIVIIFIIYAFTYGKSDFKKLDAFIQRNVAKIKGEPLPLQEKKPELYGMTYAAKQWKELLWHLAVFIVAHLLIILFIGLADQMADVTSLKTLADLWFSKSVAVPFENTIANNISKVWTLIVGIEILVVISYTIFPKGKKTER